MAAPGLHFESFVSLGGEPEAPGVRQSGKFEKVQKLKEMTWELSWEPFWTHFGTVASQSRAGKRFVALLCEVLCESVSRSVPKPVFTGNC